MAKPRDAPLSRRRAGRERLAGILRSPALRDIFMIWALLAGAPAPLHVTRTTSPHPTPIVGGGCMGMPARQRETQKLGLPSAARNHIMDAHAVPMQTHPVRVKYLRAPDASKLTGRKAPKSWSRGRRGVVEEDLNFVGLGEIAGHPLLWWSRGDLSCAVRAPIARPSPPLSHLPLLLLLRSPPRAPLPASPDPRASF